jgi:hypothetical protein
VITPPPPIDKNIIDFRKEITHKAKICPWRPPTSGLTFRRSLFEKILPLPIPVTQSPDTCIGNVALALEKGYFLNEPLSTMRIHGKNARFTDRPIISFSQALWLKNKLPSLRKIANKIFSQGLSSYRYDGVYDKQSHEIIKIYLSNI